MDVIYEGKQVLEIERDAISGLIEKLGAEFERAIALLLEASGRVIVCGIGKSGIVGRKIVATLSSTGSPAVFLHPAEGLHGDVGVVTADDLVLAISYSGESEELLKLFPYFRWVGVKIIAMTGRSTSTLAQQSDIVLDISVKREACPWDIVPTSSTTAAVALGDALAVVLLKMRGFELDDFAKRHPGGSIGRQIFLKVRDLMHARENCPTVGESVALRDAIYEMTSKGLGMTSVVNSAQKLVGVLTDGDLRRIFQTIKEPLDLPVGELMKKNPKTISTEKLAAEALRVMEDAAITSLIVKDEKDSPVGVIHIHDILRAGITL